MERGKPYSHYFWYSILLYLPYFIIIVFNILLCLIYKLNFIIVVYVCGKKPYIGFDTLHGFRYLLGVLQHIPADKGGLLYLK